MKRFFTLIAVVLGCITFSSCEKGIDPSDVEFEVAIECVASPNYYVGYYTFVCYGSLGGFNDEATIKVDDGQDYTFNVTGAKTPYSFKIHGGSKNHKPSLFNVKVLVKNKVVMETEVVAR